MENYNELPTPEEPSVDELIANAVRDKEAQIQTLTMQLYDREHEIKYLQKAIQEQEANFNSIVARLVIKLIGD